MSLQDIPDFLLVKNRVKLTPEQSAAWKALHKAAETELHAAERARAKERKRMADELQATRRAKDEARFKILRENGK